MWLVLRIIKSNVSTFFVYAENDGVSRRELWKDLIRAKGFVNNKPWCIARDMNVTLHPNEHSNGGSNMTADMLEFQDCLNTVEVEDVCKTGLHYTWTKNLQRVKAGNMSGTLKKLDRVLENEELIKSY